MLNFSKFVLCSARFRPALFPGAVVFMIVISYKVLGGCPIAVLRTLYHYVQMKKRISPTP